MRLHRLALGALGPFAGTYDLDLESVAAGGLFLLEGPTGAGKSTVLDAVTFALYGTVSGGAASKDRLHTDFPTTTEPFAELEFSVDGARYVVRRSPAHERAKQRGSGTTQVPAAVRLWRVLRDGTREPVSQRVREVDDEVLRLLGGLSAEQFRQVVVLPQGEFATFLRASAEERRAVLQRLFATDHYLAVEQVLAAMRRDAESSVRDAELAVRDELVAVLEAAGVADRDVEELLALDRAQRRDRLEVLELEIAERADAAEAALALAEQARAASAAALLADRDRHATVTRRLRAEAALEALQAADEQVAAARSALVDAARADAVAPLLDRLDDALADRALAGGDVDALDPLGSDGAAADLLSRAQELRLEAARLEEALALERETRARADELTALEVELTGLDAEVAEHAGVLAAAPAGIAALRTELDACAIEGARADALRQELVRLEERCAAALVLPDALVRQDLADRGARTAQDRDVRAREERLEALRRRLDGMAAELAAGLHDGAPCPVCGAAEHPAPAAGGEAVPSAEEIAGLDRRARERERERAAAEAALREREAEVAALRAAIGDTDPVVERDRVRAALDACTEAEARASDLRERLDAAEADLASRRLALDDLAVRRAALAERREDRVARSRAEADVVARARGGWDSVAERHAELLAEAALLTDHAHARARLEEADRRVADLDRAALEAARDAGFADLAAVRSAVLPPDHRARLSALVVEHEAAADHARRELADPAVAAADRALPDLEAAAGALREAEQRRDLAAARAAETRRCHDKVHERRGVLDQLEDATAQSCERVRPVIRVADAATGAASVNARRMTLSTYVLRERFESVVAAASRRLETMSDGRYVLVSDEGRSGNRKAGLGLAVADQWTGQQRDTATLSGGESFYASLALALGLADTVRDEVGGVELETLFIDEGFGSLDPDTLEQVLDVIDSLRDGGRTVGIVSHVAELKERIADRIEVRRLTDGSSALAVRC